MGALAALGVVLVLGLLVWAHIISDDNKRLRKVIKHASKLNDAIMHPEDVVEYKGKSGTALQAQDKDDLTNILRDPDGLLARSIKV